MYSVLDKDTIENKITSVFINHIGFIVTTLWKSKKEKFKRVNSLNWIIHLYF